MTYLRFAQSYSPDFILTPRKEQVFAKNLVDRLPREPDIVYRELLLGARERLQSIRASCDNVVGHSRGRADMVIDLDERNAFFLGYRILEHAPTSWCISVSGA